MSLENRILDLAEKITTSEDDGEIAVLAEELEALVCRRVAHLRKKHGLYPLGQYNGLSN